MSCTQVIPVFNYKAYFFICVFFVDQRTLKQPLNRNCCEKVLTITTTECKEFLFYDLKRYAWKKCKINFYNFVEAHKILTRGSRKKTNYIVD